MLAIVTALHFFGTLYFSRPPQSRYKSVHSYFLGTEAVHDTHVKGTVSLTL